MSLNIEPKKGIRLTIGQYSAIKTWQGGGKFWEHDFQLTLRQGELQEFLPRVTDEGGAVLYQQVVDGNEVVSSSLPFSNLDQIPPKQIEKLRRALSELKAKAEDPNCDANKRRMIEVFRLPDPRKDAELYRYHGSGRKKRLIVLWGVEKEAGSAIAPLKALEKMPSNGQGLEWKRWIWPLLLLLVIALLSLFFLLNRSKQTVPNSTESSPNPNGTPNSTESSPNPNGTPNSTESSPNPSGTPNSTESSPNPSGTPNSTETSPNPNGTPNSTETSPNPNGTPNSTESSPNPNGTPNSTETSPNPSGTPNSTETSPNPSGTPNSTEISPTPNGTPNSTETSPNPHADPKGPIVTPAGASRFKISAQPEGETLNGQVTLNLIAIGQNESGASVSGGFSITKWTINGKVQRDAGGHELTAASLPVMLKKGSHRISVEGVSNGKPISSEAVIDISLKVMEQSTIKVIPVQ
jgi:hypothetical protein